MAISVVERKKLWSLARNECAFPACPARLVDALADADTGELSPVVIGEEAHIRSGRVDGPRHEPEYDDALIDNYENLILLCPTHHTRVDKDNGRGYKVRDLIRMRRDHEQSAAKIERLQLVYAAYLADQWGQDNKVLFEAVDLHGPSVESMFVDVPIAAPVGSDAGKIVAAVHESAPADLEARDSTNELEVAGGAQVLLSPLWQGNALIQGGPGQGKSTLLQYVCQFHRSRLVAGKDDHYTGVSEGLRSVTTVARLPVRIDLRRFSSWLRAETAPRPERRKDRGRKRDRRPAEPQPDLLAKYLAHHIAERSGHPFSIEDLVTMLVERSVLIALDGLDEIASLKDRERASEVIATSIPRLQANSTDMVVLVATRPGATDSSRWADAGFTLMTLRPLSLGLKVQYLSKWCAQAQVSPERAEDLQDKLITNQSVPHVRELGANPMQLAILLHLLYRRGLLPQQRTELYREYVKTFLDREEQDKEPLLHAHRQVIVDVHAYLAWYLQAGAESDEHATGAISRADLVSQVRDLLEDSAESLKFADQLIAALTSRVLCLVERQTGYFEFEVQSLREYFAALYVYEEAPPQGGANSRDDCLSALVERPYWSNVMRFLVGMLSKGEVKSLVDNLRSRQGDSDSRLDPYLRWVATQLLDDRIYENQADTQIAKVVDFIFEGNGIVLGEDGLLDAGGLPIVLGEKAGARQLVEHIRSRLISDEGTGPRSELSAALLRHSPDAENREWAWANVATTLTESDVTLLAQLGAFSDLSHDRTTRLATAVGDYDSARSVPAISLLALGHYDGSDRRLMALATSEVLDGAAERVSLRTLDPDSPLGSLIALGRLEPATDQRRRVPAGRASVTPEGRTRVRRRNGQVVGADVANGFDRWRLADEGLRGNRHSASDWKELVAALQEVSPDSWLLRVVATFAADPVDLSLGTEPSLEDAAGWRAHTAWVREASENFSSREWWETHPIPSAGLARRHWLLAALAIGGTQVLVENLSAVDLAVTKLSRGEYAALHVAVHRFGNRPGARRLNLQDALRRGNLTAGARAASILTIRSEPTVNLHLYRMVVDGSLPVRADGQPAVSVLRTSVNSLNTAIPLRDLEGSRSLFPLGTLRHLPQRKVPLSEAREILAAPDRWPPDVVGLAARRLGIIRSAALPAIADLVKRDHWFAED